MIKNLDRDLIIIGTKSSTKDELLKEISFIVSKKTDKISADEIYKGLCSREELSSTGLTHGIAIPHSMFDNLDKFFLGLIIIKDGIDFDALDGDDSRLIFFSIGPKSMQNEHISNLTSISQIAQNEELKNHIINSTNVNDIFNSTLINNL